MHFPYMKLIYVSDFQTFDLGDSFIHWKIIDESEELFVSYSYQ